MGRVRSYRTFSPLPRRFTHGSAPFSASGKDRTPWGIFSFPSNPLSLGFDGSPVWGRRRYLSVALVLRLPSAGVTRYPCPVEPGLSSSGAFRLPSAAVQSSLRKYSNPNRDNCQIPLANSFCTGYTGKDNYALLSLLLYVHIGLTQYCGKL